jgi:DNA repair protein RadC
MPITDWPQEDRPREKCLSKGEQSLTDAELLAIFLKTGTQGKTAIDIARELLTDYGNLKQVLSASPHSLTQKCGVGNAKVATLRAAVELGRRYLREPLTVGTVLNSSQKTQQFLAQHLREHTNEVFACLFMDNHFRLIRFEKLFFGTINEANIYPREIVKQSLLHNAAKIILAHNHPSGNPTPSAADKEVTMLIKNALALIDVDIVDHIIVGNPANFSFAEAGMLLN